MSDQVRTERHETSFDAGGVSLRSVWERQGPAHCDCAVLCVHAITRNRHDFAPLAHRLSDSIAVYSVDLAGHGDSGRLDGRGAYVREVFLSQLLQLLAAVREPRVGLIGTSYGGLLGMRLAARPDSTLRCLVLNDASAALDSDFFLRTARKISFRPTLRSPAAVQGWMRLVFRQAGALHDTVIAELARHAAEPCVDGSYALRYDPEIAGVWLRDPLASTEHWQPWRALRCPTLLLRGELSEVLTPDALREMRQWHPETQVVEYPGVGHFPHLMSEEQLAPLRGWLLAHL